MALPASGAISLNQVNVELGSAGTTSINMNQSTVRTLFGVSSGAIAMSNGYGKANEFSFAVASNTDNANLRTLALNAGWGGTSKVIATLNSGRYFSSTAVGTAALTIDGSWPNGVEFINNGTVVGDGGNGGGSGNYAYGGAGGTGGLALLIQSAVSVRNNGTIAGGGGGGGGGGGNRSNDKFNTPVSGGGGGGGRSGLTNSSGGGPNGGAGTINGQGSGGAGGSHTITPDSGTQTVYGGSGGSGGGWGANGGGGAAGYGFMSGRAGGGGGSAGAATSGQSNVTWLATGTRLGSLG